MNLWIRGSIALLFPLGLLAQAPAIFPRGILNAGSFVPAGLPSGGIARGSIFTIFGSNMGPATPAQATSFPIQTALSNVSIQVTQGATNVAALPLYVSAGQINALMPSNTPLGLVSVRVTYNGARSNPSTVRVVNSSFGFFTLGGAGFGPGVFQDFISSDNQPINTPTATAMPGQVVTAYGTGLGPVAADNVAPTAGNLPAPVEVTVGGQPAQVLYSGRSPCCSGLDQVVFQIPDNAPSGCWVPVYLRTEKATISNAVTLAIDSQGEACAHDAVTDVYLNGGRSGILYLGRTATREDVGVTTASEITSDALIFDLEQHKGGSFDFYPPAGSCTVYLTSGDWIGTGQLPATSTPVKLLDAGTFSVTGPKGAKTPQMDPGILATNLGTFWSAPGFPNLLYLDPGPYQISASGGADVGAFQVSVTIPQPFSWTNRAQINSIDRTQPLTVNWSGAQSGQSMALIGAVTDLPTNSSAVFVCTADSDANTLTVPPAVLAGLPATRSNPNQSKAALYLQNVPFSSAVPFDAQGLDAAVATSVYLSGKTVGVK